MSIFSKDVKPSAEALKAEHPGIYQEVFALGDTEANNGINAKLADEFKKGKTEGQAQGEIIGAKDEQERIKGVEAQLQPGCEELITKMKWDGASTKGEAAEAVIQAQKEKQAKGLKELEKEAPGAIKPLPGEGDPAPSDDAIKAAWDGKDGETLKAEFGNDYSSYEAYFKNDARYIKTGKISLPAQ